MGIWAQRWLHAFTDLFHGKIKRILKLAAAAARCLSVYSIYSTTVSMLACPPFYTHTLKKKQIPAGIFIYNGSAQTGKRRRLSKCDSVLKLERELFPLAPRSLIPRNYPQSYQRFSKRIYKSMIQVDTLWILNSLRTICIFLCIWSLIIIDFLPNILTLYYSERRYMCFIYTYIYGVMYVVALFLESFVIFACYMLYQYISIYIPYPPYLYYHL